MSGRQWKPGDVALVRCGPDYVIALWSGDDCQPRAVGQDHPAEPHWHTQSARYIAHDSRDVRPLAVIDPEDREQVERLYDAFNAEYVKRNGATLRDGMVTALRSLIEPPKPDEPTGLGAVVEAINDNYFVRDSTGDNPWRRVSDDNDEYPCQWRDIDVARVLSEGVRDV